MINDSNVFIEKYFDYRKYFTKKTNVVDHYNKKVYDERKSCPQLLKEIYLSNNSRSKKLQT